MSDDNPTLEEQIEDDNPTLEEQIEEVKRELVHRSNVYPRRIEEGRLPPEEANRRMYRMAAVLETLLKIQRAQNPELPF